MKIQDIILAPLSWLFGLVISIRNGLYKAKILHSRTVSIPTIAVGNLAVGGTGKTPFVEYLIRTLSPHYKIAVLSLGYKRRTRGFVMADEKDTALTIGDEPMQIHQKFPSIPVAVCKDRIHGIHRLQQLVPDLQAVILDDAFQYRRLRCGFYILLTAYDRLYIDDHFLPLGRLRDNKHESLRASAVVVTKCPSHMRPIDQRIVDTKLHLPVFQHLHFASITYPELVTNQRVLVVAGIANPEYLVDQIKKSNPKTEVLTYPDHHAFSGKDIAEIEYAAQSADVIYTTEKDYMRLSTMELPDSIRTKLQTVPIRTQITDEEVLVKHLHQYINENIYTHK